LPSVVQSSKLGDRSFAFCMKPRAPLHVSLTLSFCAMATLSLAQTTLVNTGAVWKYSSGTDLGTAWKEPAYNDASWAAGFSELGFGETGQATTIPGGPSTNRYPTHYFRHAVNIANPAAFQSFLFNVKRDDGIVVYLNGVEVFRDNIPAGIPAYNSFAAAQITDDGNTWIPAVVSPASFVNGVNVIAAEVHQINATSSDLTFDLQLIGDSLPAVAISRGPYFQLGTSTSVFLRWKTSIRTDTKVNLGTTAGNINQAVSDLYSSTDHIMQLTGLSPDTKYFYSIGSEGGIFQGDTMNFFITAPLIGTEKTTRIWVTGDCGTAQTVQTKVRNAYQNFIGNNYTDLWLLLGDNAYENGTDAEYQSKFFQPYMSGKVMRQTVLFPAPGNHDYANNADSLASRNRPYHQIFTLPKAGEAGGVPSGTEMYYSYDYANIHFISLDSYGTESGKKIFDTTSAQITWLKQDLAANTQKWTILYWHHPPYTMGTHNSDTESELVNIRDKVLRILDRYKVDLILCGHSHTYERSKIMKGHYGLEGTYSSALHNASTSSGLYDGSTNSCPYVKSTASEQNEGIVYVVAGSAGKIGAPQTGAYPHNAMQYSNSLKGGSLYLEVSGKRLDAKWIAADSMILDKFTILKDVNNATDITINETESAQLSASWQGAYAWNALTETTKSVTVSPVASTDYFVQDGNFNCVHDTFHVTVLPLVNISGAIITEDDDSIQGVTVKLSGSHENTVITGSNGLYSFNVKQGGNYTITPTKTNDVATNNGVTTLDISLMRRHILGTTLFDSPYKVIAADGNNTSIVSTADIPVTRIVVLNNTLKFPPANSRLWEFVPSDYVFQLPLPNMPYNPFPFPKTKTYNNITTNQTNQNFIGVKLGDVNGSWNSTIP